jgi:hypothetical protein
MGVTLLLLTELAAAFAPARRRFDFFAFTPERLLARGEA